MRKKKKSPNHFLIWIRNTFLSALAIGAFALLFGTLAQAAEVGTSGKSEGLDLKVWKKNLNNAISENNKAKIDALMQWNSLRKEAFPSNSDAIQDKNTLTKARQLFADGKYQQALDHYNKISKTSDYWLEALEEKSWTYLKMGDFEKSLSQVRTLMTPVFVSAIGPEPFLLKSIAELKICDYKGMFATLREFKAEQKQRLQAIHQLADTGDSKDLQEALKSITVFPIDSIEIGKSQKLLPRLFYLDREVKEAILQIKINEAFLEALESSELVSKTKLAEKTDSLRKIRDSKEKLRKRVSFLANVESEEYYRIVQKLQLAEVEVTQRVFADSGRKISKNQNGFKSSPDDLTFIDNGEVWIDELDKYEAKVNACDSNIRRKM